MSVLGTVVGAPSQLPFHGLRGSGEPALNGGLFPPSTGSRHYGTPRSSAVKWGDDPTRPTPKRQELGLRYRDRTPTAREY